MKRHLLILIAIALAGCVIETDTVEVDSARGGETAVAEQTVTLRPVFEIVGLENLPNGLVLTQLDLGVGAIFLDQMTDEGYVFASQRPFQLNFLLARGEVRAEGPTMILPAGGEYQVSVQLEPQVLRDSDDTPAVTSAADPSQASFAVHGEVIGGSYMPEASPYSDEPAPWPWMPDDPALQVNDLQRSLTVLPFNFSSARSVRFTLENIELETGEIELVLRLHVGHWVEETIRPALDASISGFSEEDIRQVSTGERDLVINDRVGLSDGMEALIGGIDVIVRK